MTASLNQEQRQEAAGPKRPRGHICVWGSSSARNQIYKMLTRKHPRSSLRIFQADRVVWWTHCHCWQQTLRALCASMGFVWRLMSHEVHMKPLSITWDHCTTAYIVFEFWHTASQTAAPMMRSCVFGLCPLSTTLHHYILWMSVCCSFACCTTQAFWIDPHDAANPNLWSAYARVHQIIGLTHPVQWVFPASLFPWCFVWLTVRCRCHCKRSTLTPLKNKSFSQVTPLKAFNCIRLFFVLDFGCTNLVFLYSDA